MVIASSMALFQPLEDTFSPGEISFLLNPPDEHARFLVPWYICQHGTLPTGFEEEIRIPSYGFSYGLYNVFPYIVQGYLMRFVSFFTDQFRVLLWTGRFVNVMSGTLMAYLVYLLSRKLFVRAGLRWMFCFGVMYLPQSMFVHTYINTDSMCMLSVAMMVYALVSAYQDKFTRSNCLMLAGGIILCALSYYNAYGYILSSIFLFAACFAGDHFPGGKKALAAFLREYDWKQMLRKGIFISAIVLLGIGWWFIRSFFVLDGDILGLKTREEMAIQYASEEVNPLTMPTYQNRGETVGDMITSDGFWSGTFISFVAAFGSLSLIGNPWMYRAFALFFWLGALSCMFLLYPKRDFLSGLPSWKRLFFHGNMIFCLLMPTVLMIYYSYTTDFQNQGRYLLPEVIPIMYYVVRGYEKLLTSGAVVRKYSRPIIALCIFLFVFSTLWMTYAVSLPLFLEAGREI